MQSAREVLANTFGWSTFRPYQEPLIDAVLAGRSVLGILPTAAGKSLCYQIPALMLPPTTLVISPLIALMTDQVRQLTDRGVAAVAWHSQLSATETRALYQRLVVDPPRLVFLSPERLWHPDVQQWLQRTSIPLLVVDEAHCLSEWGYDFRPDYRQIPAILPLLGYPPVMALTATALPRVREDICTLLEVPTVIQAPMDRPNVALQCHPAPNRLSQQQQIHRILDTFSPTDRILLYADSRKDTERWAEHLEATRGRPARAYHAGLAPDRRMAAQHAFTEGTVPLLVATTAFGMGVDIPAIRAVLHVGLPSSPADYYQQIGRAGRDGAPALASLAPLLAQSRRIHAYHLDQARPHPGLQGVWASGLGLSPEALWHFPSDPDFFWPMQLLVSYLTEHGLADRVRGSAREAPILRVHGTIDEAGYQTMMDRLHQRHAARQRDWDAMLAFVETPTCRRTWIHAFFGAAPPVPAPLCCDRCDPTAFVATTATTGPAKTMRPHQGERPLLVVLEEWRQVLAQLRHVPPHHICSDAGLLEAVAVCPHHPADLARLSHWTEDQRRQFGPSLLTACAPYAAPPPVATSSPVAPKPVSARQGWCTVLRVEGGQALSMPLAERRATWSATSLTLAAVDGSVPDHTLQCDRVLVQPQQIHAVHVATGVQWIVQWQPTPAAL